MIFYPQTCQNRDIVKIANDWYTICSFFKLIKLLNEFTTYKQSPSNLIWRICYDFSVVELFNAWYLIPQMILVLEGWNNTFYYINASIKLIRLWSLNIDDVNRNQCEESWFLFCERPNVVGTQYVEKRAT